MGRWSNAFKIPQGEELCDSDKDFIKNIVIKIKKRKLENIALFILNSSFPIRTIASNIIHFLEPTLGFVIQKKHIEKVAELIENPKGFKFIIEELEREER